MWKLFLALMLVASSAAAQEQATAYDALKVVGTQFHRAALNRVISVTGVDGDPQPVRWNILIADRNAPGGVRELQVAGGRIISNQTPGRSVVGSTEAATINTAQLNLDSSGAFSVASYTADKSHTNFSQVAYTLRTNDRGVPVWIVTLQDEARRPIGTIHIAANRGNVTRVEGLYRGANMANVEEDRVERTEEEEAGDEEIYAVDEDEEDENAVKREIKHMFRRTKRDARRMFERVSRSFEDFFNRG
ncbi:MAG: hypothetical protein ABR589_09790 [Chthoniobacterales bacterium]